MAAHLVAFAILIALQNSVSPASWTTRATDHFDIYYQRQQASRLDDVTRAAERAYSRVSFDLKYELAAKVPLILVQTDRDLPSDRQQATALVRASGAPDRDHLVFSMESIENRDAVLVHELTHQFQFELIPSTSPMPAWVPEGLSDHEAGTWRSSDLRTLRDAVAAGVIPSVHSLSASDRLWGHAVFDFVAAEYGTQGIRRYVTALQDKAPGADPTLTAFGVSASDFDHSFQTYLRTQFNDR